MAKKRILVAPLDWGLGHATRSIPVVRELLARGYEVVLGSNGRPLALLRKEFPGIETVELPPYDVRYPTSNIYWNISIQLPQIVSAVFTENRLMRNLVREKKIDGIISDHRLGCSHPAIPSVVIAHQLHLRVENRVIEWAVRKIHYAVLRRFQECWVPDYPDSANSLGGELDHPPLLSPPTRYIGPLSRLNKREIPVEYDYLILLSGPEPQRTRLEERLRQQAGQLPHQILLVQGRTDVEKRMETKGNLSVVSYLTSEELETTIAKSGFVICRSGYSTLLDLAACGKRALLIPTPGQTEQEYLAEYLEEKGFFWYKAQAEVDLAKDLESAERYTGFPLTAENHLLEAALNAFLERVG
jgi:uncharacterized protein (TIGR00661 family)